MIGKYFGYNFNVLRKKYVMNDHVIVEWLKK